MISSRKVVVAFKVALDDIEVAECYIQPLIVGPLRKLEPFKSYYNNLLESCMIDCLAG